jgi:hypothetical protein
LVQQLRNAPTPETTRRAIQLYGDLDRAPTGFPKARLKEALSQAINKDPVVFLKGFKLPGAYDLSAVWKEVTQTGVLSGPLCQSVGDAFRQAPDFIRYPLMDTMLERVSNLTTSDALLREAAAWPRQESCGGYDERSLRHKSCGHELWSLRWRFRMARSARESKVAASVARELVDRYVAALPEGSLYVLGALEPYFRQDIRALLENIAAHCAPSGKTKLQQCVGSLRRALVGAGRDSLAAFVDEEWRIIGPKPMPQQGDTATHRAEGSSTGMDTALPTPDEKAWFTPDRLVEIYGLKKDALRKRLERYRRNNLNGWKESEDRRPREPKYLYQVQAIKSILKDLRASSQRPAK